MPLGRPRIRHPSENWGPALRYPNLRALEVRVSLRYAENGLLRIRSQIQMFLDSFRWGDAVLLGI